MFITQSYKYNLNGTIYVSGNLPENAELLETMNILNANEGYDLVRISNDENVGNSIWLHNGDIQENYKEIESKDIEE